MTNKARSQEGPPVRIARGQRVVTVQRNPDGSADLTVETDSFTIAVLTDAERRQLIEALGGRP